MAIFTTIQVMVQNNGRYETERAFFNGFWEHRADFSRFVTMGKKAVCHHENRPISPFYNGRIEDRQRDLMRNHDRPEEEQDFLQL